MCVVRNLVAELQIDPNRFHATDGYHRLLEALRQGHPSGPLHEVLSKESDTTGDLLWTVAELETVEPFVSDARQHMSSSDRGTAAYAMEIVLRGARGRDDLRTALDTLRTSDAAVCEHAVRTLAGQGVSRLREILEVSNYTWSRTIADKLSDSILRKDIEALVSDSSPDRQVIGLVLATLSWEQDRSYADCFAYSREGWIRAYGEWLSGDPMAG